MPPSLCYSLPRTSETHVTNSPSGKDSVLPSQLTETGSRCTPLVSGTEFTTCQGLVPGDILLHRPEGPLLGALVTKEPEQPGWKPSISFIETLF